MQAALSETTKIAEAIAGWEADMRRRGVRPASIKHFRRYAENAAGVAEWITVGDVSFESAARFLAGMRERGRWSSSTHDQCASALRCFGLWMHRANLREANPLVHLEGIGDPGEPGSRALTTAEVRAIVKEAITKAKYDGRAAKSSAPVFWVFLARTGLRYAEAIRCQWKAIDLDGEHGPHLLTDPAWSKNRRRQSVPINPELARLLRAHAKSVPSGPLDRVFPMPPARPTFARTREAAGVAYADRRGRKATPHSLRKTLDTELDALGIATGVRHRIIRHAHGLDERYLDHAEVADAAAVAALPDLWPTDFDENGLDRPPGLDDNRVAMHGSTLHLDGPKCPGAVTPGHASLPTGVNRRGTPDRPPARVSAAFGGGNGQKCSADALANTQTGATAWTPQSDGASGSAPTGSAATTPSRSTADGASYASLRGKPLEPGESSRRHVSVGGPQKKCTTTTTGSRSSSAGSAALAIEPPIPGVGCGSTGSSGSAPSRLPRPTTSLCAGSPDGDHNIDPSRVQPSPASRSAAAFSEHAGSVREAMTGTPRADRACARSLSAGDGSQTGFDDPSSPAAHFAGVRPPVPEADPRDAEISRLRRHLGWALDQLVRHAPLIALAALVACAVALSQLGSGPAPRIEAENAGGLP